MRFTTLAAAVVAITCLIATPAVWAHVPAESTELEWHAGLLHFDKNEVGTLNQDQLLLGFFAARNLTGGLGIEGAFQVAPASDFKAYLAHGNLVYNINVPAWDRFVPFVTGGAGIFALNPDIGNSTTDFAINFGGGAKAFLTPRLALRGDVRDHVVFATGNTTNNLQFSAGLSYFIRSGL